MLNYSLACTGLSRVPLNDTWRRVNNEPVTYSSLSAALFCMVINWREEKTDVIKMNFKHELLNILLLHWHYIPLSLYFLIDVWQISDQTELFLSQELGFSWDEVNFHCKVQISCTDTDPFHLKHAFFSQINTLSDTHAWLLKGSEVTYSCFGECNGADMKSRDIDIFFKNII